MVKLLNLNFLVLMVKNKLFYEDLINILRTASNKLLTTPHDYKQNFYGHIRFLTKNNAYK